MRSASSDFGPLECEGFGVLFRHLCQLGLEALGSGIAHRMGGEPFDSSLVFFSQPLKERDHAGRIDLRAIEQLKAGEICFRLLCATELQRHQLNPKLLHHPAQSRRIPNTIDTTATKPSCLIMRSSPCRCSTWFSSCASTPATSSPRSAFFISPVKTTM